MIPFHTFCEDNNIKQDTLSNHDILNYVKQLRSSGKTLATFRGCFMRDTLPKKLRTNESGIVNLEPQSENGSHWCCYFKKGKYKFYFDPYGLDPTNEMLKYLKPSERSSDVITSTFQIQKPNTNICGSLCLYVLYYLSKACETEDCENEDFLKILISLKDEINA